MRKDAAVGVDGVTWETYGANLEANLQDLHERLRTMRYRHQPIRRVHIPKENGSTRPIGVSAVEDKIVQGALYEVLEAVYEQDFLDCSHGFRRGRKAHDALRALDRAVMAGAAHVILEFDIVSFFDSLVRPTLKEMLQTRIDDRSLMRLIGKCLHVGILDGARFEEPEEGTVQGSALSPLLGNIYLHHVLDLWFENEVKPLMRGKVAFVRYADDGVFGFERQDDAEWVMKALEQRLASFGLKLHPDKTRLLDFRRPPRSQTGGKGPGTFDFLGFTIYWGHSRKGNWVLKCKTRNARLRRAKEAVYDWCRRHRHLPVQEQHTALMRKLRGHFNYFGVTNNSRCLDELVESAKKTWHKWLNRRSQRSRLTWKRFEALLADYPLQLPTPTILLWGRTP
jgi:group II intron reverse transcriptase/maturase